MAQTRRVMLLLALLPAAVLVGGGRTASAPAATKPSTATLVRIQAKHQAGHDLITFQFDGSVPGSRSVGYVHHLIADPRGTTVPMPGRAILRVVFRTAAAHTDAGRTTAPSRLAFALPNAMAVVRSGDFEGVLSYGIALARRASFKVYARSNPSRVVVDIAAAFRTVPMTVYFFNSQRFAANTPPFVTGVVRDVTPATAATALMDRLFAGPTAQEQSRGLRLVASRATGFTTLSIVAWVARIRLAGGCSSGGSTATIAGEISATLGQLPGVHWVKIYDPAGRTEQPYSAQDSIPECLEP